jgi:tetratricopeptide (TPR) repeat protein
MLAIAAPVDFCSLEGVPPAHGIAAPRETPFWARRSVAAAVLLAAVAIAYHSYLPGCFVLDDFSSVLENSSIRQLWPPSVWWVAPSEAGVCGRPRANFSFALNFAAGGVHPAGYHAVNIALHGAVALALFAVVCRTLRQCANGGLSANTTAALALAIALLWAVHPLASGAVGYVSQRTELLMALNLLLLLYALARYANSGRRRWAVAAVAACGAGMASKEVMAAAPVVALLYDRTFFAGSFRAAWRIRGRLHGCLFATWFWLAWLIATSDLPARGVGFGLGVGGGDYLLVQAQAIWRYGRLALWPDALVFDYGREFGRRDATAALALVGVAVVLAASGWAVVRRPAAGFAAAWVLLLLAPTTSFIPVIQQPVAESRMYLPLAGLVALAVVGLHRLMAGRTRMLLAGGVGVALVFSGLTLQRGRTFQTEVALWQDTVARRPESARAHGNLGAALLRANRLPESQVASLNALQLRPGYPEAHTNLGIALEQAGRAEESIPHFEAALRADPTRSTASYNLGSALLRSGRAADAVPYLELTARHHSASAAAPNNLSVALLQLDRPAEAATHARAAVQRDPRFAEAHYNLANALARLGANAEAVNALETALRLDPRSAKTHNNLGVLKLRLGRPNDAIRHFETALQLDPHYAEARRNLAAVQRR